MQQRADRVEAVGGDESAGDPVPQALLDLGGQAMRDGLKLGVKLRATRTQGIEHLPSGAGGGLGRHRVAAVGLQQPRHILAQHEGDRRPAGGRLAGAMRLAGGRIVGVGGGFDHRQPTPHDLTRQAEIVQPLGPIGLGPLGQQPLPVARRPLEALQLLDHLGDSRPAMQPAGGSRVPPGLQEVLPALLADRARLGPAPVAAVGVDAGEQPAGAPLLAPIGLEAPTDDRPARAQGLQGDDHRRRGQAAGCREVLHRDGARDVEMTLNEGHRRLIGLLRTGRGSEARRKLVVG